MFSKKKNIKKTNDMGLELDTYIESGDMFNSKFLYMIPKLPAVGAYKIPDLYKFRIDLISKELYDTVEMSQILMIYNGVTIEDLKEGVYLQVPSKNDILELKFKISTVKNPELYLNNIKV